MSPTLLQCNIACCATRNMMAGLAATTLDLSRLRGRWRELVDGGLPPASRLAARGDGDARFRRVEGFGSNPGELDMLAYVPDGVKPAPALVVVLHGCKQTGAGYAIGAGWATLAERHGFLLVCPQQRAANNPQNCFNWFVPGDTCRGGGEPLSIRQMVEHVVSEHGVDRRRIYVTGLSAGGAMAAVMLATCPDLFAGGGVVAGLPYGAAGNVQQALHAMFQGVQRPAGGWGDLVRTASPHRGPWPRLSIWHGSADRTVVPGNADELAKQWCDLHGLQVQASATEASSSLARSVWRDAQGTEVIESIRIAGLGHGAPLLTGEGEGSCGTAGPFLLEAGISSSYGMARFWGLIPEAAALNRSQPEAAGSVSAAGRAAALVARTGEVTWPSEPARPAAGPSAAPRTSATGTGTGTGTGLGGEIGVVIEKALRAAGLMRS